MTPDSRAAAMHPGESLPQRYRLVLADDHEDILNEVRRLLAPEFDVVGAVKDGTALIQAAAELQPDAAICDIHMPGLDGIECGAHILREGLSKAVILLTMYDAPQLVEKALREGIRGYVLKVDASEELLPAIYTVLRGGKYISRGVSQFR